MAATTTITAQTWQTATGEPGRTSAEVTIT